MASNKQPKYDTNKTAELISLRKDIQPKLSQEEVANFFELKSYGTVYDWEYGYRRPPERRHRRKFIVYLADRRKVSYEKLKALWKDLMVGQWGWAELTTEELRIFYPTRIELHDTLERREAVPPAVERLETVRHFTGRRKELRQLVRALQPRVVVTLCGPGGIGKTALAAQAIHKLFPDHYPSVRFPDGAVIHNFYQDRYAHNALTHIARRFKVEVEPGTSPAAAARHALAGKQALLVLEGTENADDLEAVLAERNNCGVLISTRKRQHARLGHHRIDLKPFEEDEGVELLEKWAGEQITDEESAGDIWKLVGGLPLAIRLAGSYMAWRKEDALTYLDWLRETPLEALDHGRRRLESIPILLKKSVAQVDETAQQILKAVGLLAPAPFDPQVILEALALSTGQLRRSLDQLLNLSLLDPVDKRYKVSHTLIHTYARQKMVAADEIVRRLAAYYTTLAQDLTDQGPDSFTKLDLERNHILATLEICVERRSWKTVQNLAWAMGTYLDLQGHWTDRKTVSSASLASARALENRYNECESLRVLGVTCLSLAQVEQAINYFEQSLVIAREIGDREVEAADLNDLGNAARDLSKMNEAIDYYEQAITIAHEIGDRSAEGLYLGNLGNAYSDLAKMEEALDCYQQALIISRETGDRSGEETHLNNLGTAYADLGLVEKSIEYYEQALAITREAGDRYSEGLYLGNLGLAYWELGQLDQAIEYHEQALSIAREINDRYSEGNHLNGLGLAYNELRRMDEAIDCFEQALAIAREIGNQAGEAAALGNLGDAYINIGQLESAREHSEQALLIARAIGDRRGEGIYLGNLGTAFYKLGNIEEGIDNFEQALTISREIGDRRSEGYDLGNLGGAYHDLGYIEQAIDFYEQGLAIAQEVGDRFREAEHLGNLGNAHTDLGNIKQALDCYLQGLNLSQELGDRENEETILKNLKVVYNDPDQVEIAIEYYEQRLPIAHEMGDQHSEGNILYSLGIAYGYPGQYEKGIQCLRQAQVTLEEIETLGMTLVQENLKEILQ